MKHIPIFIAFCFLIFICVYTSVYNHKIDKENTKLLINYKNALIDYKDALIMIKQNNEVIEILKSEAGKKNKCFYYVCSENGTVIVLKYYESLPKTKKNRIKLVGVE